MRVFNDEIHVVMNQSLELIALSGYLTPARRELAQFQLSSDTAINLGYQQLTGRTLEPQQLVRLPTDDAGFERFKVEGQETPVRVRRVWFPMPNGLEPAWHVELNVGSGLGLG